jgi:hypothetical protein
MVERTVYSPDFRRKSRTGLLGLVAGAATILLGLRHTTQTRAESQAQTTTASLVYDVASIKPNKSGSDRQRVLFPPSGLDATNVPLHRLPSSQTNLRTTGPS